MLLIELSEGLYSYHTWVLVFKELCFKRLCTLSCIHKCSMTFPVKSTKSKLDFHAYIRKLIKNTFSHSNIYVCKLIKAMESIPPIHTKEQSTLPHRNGICSEISNFKDLMHLGHVTSLQIQLEIKIHG